MMTIRAVWMLRSLVWVPITLLLTTGIPAIALPTPIAPKPVPRSANDLNPFYAYLNDQKYTLYLGDSRGACAYHIDPTDVYAQGESRFVTAKVSQGMQGTACRGVLQFEVLQADCQAKVLYGLAPLTAEDSRNRGWQRFELSLYKPTPGTGKAVTTQELATKVCALPTKPRR
jgi:hypothetical protein